MYAPLYNKIKELNGCYPLHMPGHKRNIGFFGEEASLLSLDITEIEGSDNMHCPKGAILEAEQAVAELNGCDKSLFLINGGSCGVLTAMLAVLNPQDKAVVCRNAHKSVYNGFVLSGAAPVYVSPRFLTGSLCGSFSCDDLESAFRLYPEAKAVIVTSPTYEGVVEDIPTIADIAHSHGAILIADETHGAHFSFYADFPKAAIRQGADISINSWHKTLPCINQSAVINVNTQRVDFDRIMAAYSMVQSTSPSYIIMGLMDKARAILTENKKYMSEYVSNIASLRLMLSSLKGMKLFNGSDFGCYDYDLCKIAVLTGENFSGKTLAQILLKEYNIQVELWDREHIIAITSAADTPRGLDAFGKALLEIDKALKPYKALPPFTADNNITVPHISPRDAFYGKTRLVELKDACGHIAGECITPFPPDIPIVTPGEYITKEHIRRIKHYMADGAEILGINDNKIKITEDK